MTPTLLTTGNVILPRASTHLNPALRNAQLRLIVATVGLDHLSLMDVTYVLTCHIIYRTTLMQ